MPKKHHLDRHHSHLLLNVSEQLKGSGILSTDQVLYVCVYYRSFACIFQCFVNCGENSEAVHDAAAFMSQVNNLLTTIPLTLSYLFREIVFPRHVTAQNDR